MAAVELNVSAEGVTPNASPVTDQASAISDALELLGTTPVPGTTYSKTAYFPAGVYYLGDPIFTRPSNTTFPVNVTIRGDGPGVTILKMTSLKRPPFSISITMSGTLLMKPFRSTQAMQRAPKIRPRG